MSPVNSDQIIKPFAMNRYSTGNMGKSKKKSMIKYTNDIDDDYYKEPEEGPQQAWTEEDEFGAWSSQRKS